MATLTGIVKSLSITPKDGAAITPNGVRSASYTTSRMLSEDRDPDNDVPYHWWTGNAKSFTVTLRDRDLALALQAMPCITALECVLAAPRTACAASATHTDSVTITGTNLVANGDIEPAAGGPEGTPTEYSVTFVVTHVDGVAGTLTAAKDT